ncbi:MAG: hypothetical protein GXO38_00700 [Epsilonproteobacteria bacterium]|nr:hypothetical protein [Campylobacterota bacterium]
MVFKFAYTSNAPHFAKRLEAIARLTGTRFEIRQERDIYLEIEEYEAFAKAADEHLFNSLFFQGVEVAEELKGEPVAALPLSVGVCQNCIGKILDPNSRHYYYPFTSCASCGSQSALALSYPFTRSNTLLAPIKPCEACQKEGATDPFCKDYPLLTCTQCNVPVVIHDSRKEFWANEKEEFRELFAIAANALQDGKSVAIKTLNGFKRFSLTPTPASKLLLCNLPKAKEKLLFLNQELQALFSIERPKIFATLADEELKEVLGAVVEVKAFDDGFTFLLTQELAQVPFIFYEEGAQGDLVMEYFLELDPPKESHLFFNKHHRFIAAGERFIIPQKIQSDKTVVHGDYLLHEGVLDKIERFDVVEASEVVAFSEDEVEHGNVRLHDFAAAALRSVMREHEMNSKALGLYLSEAKRFYYLDGASSKELFDFGAIPEDLEDSIAQLREGSAKLVERFFERFDANIEDGDMWERAAAIIGIEGGFEELRKAAMSFGGKGGLSVDCRIAKERFEYESLFASLMSYRLAGADSVTLAYSLFESLGDFCSNALRDMAAPIGVQQFVIAGKFIAVTPFLSRFTRNLPHVKTNIALPVDGINGIIGV